MKRSVYIAVPTLDGKFGSALTQFLCVADRLTRDPASSWSFTKGFYRGYRPVAYMRNAICRDFLESGCERLWFLDSDIIPPPDAFALLDVEDDIVAGAVPGYKPAADGNGLVVNLLAYERSNGTHDSIALPEEARHVDAAGTGCMLIHRRVLEDDRMRLCVDGPEDGRPDNWAPAIFRMVTEPWGAVKMTADLNFCQRARECGYTITLWPDQLFGQYETLDLRDVLSYGARCAASVEVMT